MRVRLARTECPEAGHGDRERPYSGKQNASDGRSRGDAIALRRKPAPMAGGLSVPNARDRRAGEKLRRTQPHERRRGKTSSPGQAMRTAPQPETVPSSPFTIGAARQAAGGGMPVERRAVLGGFRPEPVATSSGTPAGETPQGRQTPKRDRPASGSSGQRSMASVCCRGKNLMRGAWAVCHAMRGGRQPGPAMRVIPPGRVPGATTRKRTAKPAETRPATNHLGSWPQP